MFHLPITFGDIKSFFVSRRISKRPASGPQDPAAASLSVSRMSHDDAMGLRNAEFLRRDDSSVHWRCKTLADMDKATTSNNSKNESQPIKARLKKMADQRQMSRRQMLREKADQACLETLYLHSLEPPLAALNN